MKSSNSDLASTPTLDRAKIGQIVKVYGHDCRIFKIHPFGTIDVVRLDETRAYRLSGLPL